MHVGMHASWYWTSYAQKVGLQSELRLRAPTYTGIPNMIWNRYGEVMVSCCSYSDFPQSWGVSLSLSLMESQSWSVVQTKAIQVANVCGPI